MQTNLEEVEKVLKIRIIFAVLMTLTVSVAIIAPVIAFNKSRCPPVTNNNYNNPIFYITQGETKLQLPPPGGAIANHPTNLGITAFKWEKDSSFNSAGHDVLTVNIWISAANAYRPVAYITDNDNPDFIAFIKNAWKGFPIAENVIVVGNRELEVWTEKNALFANLTKPVDILFGDSFPTFKSLNFTLPAMYLVFREIGDEYKVEKGEQTTTMGTQPNFSGYTASQYGCVKPTWVEYKIPGWIVGQSCYTAGVLQYRWTVAWTIPT